MMAVPCLELFLCRFLQRSGRQSVGVLLLPDLHLVAAASKGGGGEVGRASWVKSGRVGRFPMFPVKQTCHVTVIIFWTLRMHTHSHRTLTAPPIAPG